MGFRITADEDDAHGKDGKGLGFLTQGCRQVEVSDGLMCTMLFLEPTPVA